MIIKSIVISFGIIIFLLVLELIRKEKLTFKYASWWLLVSLTAIFFAFFDHFLNLLSTFFGFSLPSNFIFFSVLFVFVILSFLLTCFLCQQNRHNDSLAQKVGILEFEINKLKKENGKKSEGAT